MARIARIRKGGGDHMTATEPESTTEAGKLVKYSPSDAAIAEIKEKCLPLKADTPQGYELVRVALGEIRTLRTSIEKRRVELKADALAWGRKVDSEAHRITNLLLEIEEPLKAKKQIVDDEKERVAREKVEAAESAQAERIAAELAVREAMFKAARDAEETRLKVETDRVAAERKALMEEYRLERIRILAEQKAEQERLTEERRSYEAEMAEKRRWVREQEEKLAET